MSEKNMNAPPHWKNSARANFKMPALSALHHTYLKQPYLILLNRWRMYTIYASSRTSSQRHSKMPKVVPLPKTNDLSDPSNYRPISLLPVIFKPLERHIHKHLLQYLENNQPIHQYQSGFCPDHSCHTALTRLCDGWLSAINSSEIGTLNFQNVIDQWEVRGPEREIHS